MLVAGDGGGPGPGSMALQVAPQDLVAAAQSFEAAADKAASWVAQNGQDLLVEPAGGDTVSTNVAGWLSDNAAGVMGALPAVQLAIKNLTDAAVQMRATAATYGITDMGSTSAIRAAAST